MVTATARALLAGALVLATAGCGSSSSTRPAGSATVATTAASTALTATEPAATVPAATASAAFTWLQPAPAPAGWLSVRIPSGATLSYPPGWQVVKGDRGTATAVLLEHQGHDLGYLNLTPRQPPETLAGWITFRARHNRGEGERDVTTEGATADLHFRTGHGACVQDAYTTSAARRYVEIACLVAGAHATSVIVGAALSASWSAQRAVIERAISAMTT